MKRDRLWVDGSLQTGSALALFVLIRTTIHHSLRSSRTFLVRLHIGIFLSSIFHLLSSVAALPRCVNSWFPNHAET